ncbi:DoxX family protein [Kytococcus schroeteri]|uniref:DoxX family protein n=1 Tax=Kytococcus schroeteri TaxID=138300 RepID=UPI001143A737|nr:DoxX family protein [Kytococcus schroeteri]
MDPIRLIARPMLGAIFVSTGVNHIKNPAYGSEVAQRFADENLEPLGVDVDGPTLMKLHGYASVLAGSGLALGVAPRLCALALAADVTAVNLATHRFWEQQGEERQGTQIQFFKDLAIAGGLLVAAVDTQGKPGLAYRAQHAGDVASAKAEAAAAVAGLKKELLGLKAENKALQAKVAVAERSGKASARVAKASGAASGAAGLLGSQARTARKAFVAKKRKDSLVDRFTDAVDDAVKSAKKSVNA